MERGDKNGEVSLLLWRRDSRETGHALGTAVCSSEVTATGGERETHKCRLRRSRPSERAWKPWCCCVEGVGVDDSSTDGSARRPGEQTRGKGGEGAREGSRLGRLSLSCSPSFLTRTAGEQRERTRQSEATEHRNRRNQRKERESARKCRVSVFFLAFPPVVSSRCSGKHYQQTMYSVNKRYESKNSQNSARSVDFSSTSSLFPSSTPLLNRSSS